MERPNFHHLPPAKRFKLMHQQQGTDSCPNQSSLPAKKRKGCVDSDSPPVVSSGYCLPARKRVWAFPPFDLNLELGEDCRTDEEESTDDGILCAVCGSTDGDAADPIVLCDGCDLMVHATCYGHPLTNGGVPEGDWFCAQCLSLGLDSKSGDNKRRFSCCLCPNSGGAVKATTDGRWAHLVCAIYVPEVFFLDPENREGIDIGRVGRKRWEEKCYLCGSYQGCVVDCSEPKCPLGFHVSCGMEEDLCLDYRQGRKRGGVGGVVAAFCRAHTELWKKQERTGKFKIVARDG